MKRTSVCLLVGTMLLGLTIFTQAKSSESMSAPTPQELNALMKQRVEVLRELASMLQEQYRKGETKQLDWVVRTANDLWFAELEFAKDRDQRLAVCQQRVQRLKAVERIAELLRMAKEVSSSDVLAARAARLEAEVHLLREQAGGK
jgi:hypothetical protein